MDGFHLSSRQFISHPNLLSLLAGNLYNLSPFLLLLELGAAQPTITNRLGYYWYITQVLSMNVINSLIIPSNLAVLHIKTLHYSHFHQQKQARNSGTPNNNLTQTSIHFFNRLLSFGTQFNFHVSRMTDLVLYFQVILGWTGGRVILTINSFGS